jgi:LmbE family N-acetylglucosaminyl deacetylase
VDVHLVTATLGEAGQVVDPTMIENHTLSALREQELRCACQQYGNINLHLLGYIDGQTAIVPPSTAVYRIVKLIRQHTPQVIITFGPDGVYGHFDHLVIHRWSSAAVTLAGQTDRWPTAGPPHQVTKLYYRVIPLAQIDKMAEMIGRDFVPMDGDIPFPFYGYPPEQITTVINVQDYTEAKLKGINCHGSQLDPSLPYNQEEYLKDPSFWQETFMLANVDTPSGQIEDDLFAGLR